MSPANKPTPCSVPMLRPTCLSRSEERWIASPAKGDFGFAPFVLPPPARSLIDWLGILGHRFWQENRRCMTALLLIDCRRCRWTLRLPRQRCHADFAEWEIEPAEDLTRLPASIRIGGSFQTLASGKDAASEVPTNPGFHFRLNLGAFKPLTAYIRFDDQLTPEEPCTFLTDNFAQAINAAAPRVRLA